MKRVISYFITAVFLVNLLATSCQRSSGEVLEDSKTAWRHMDRGVRSLGGKHGSSRQVVSSRGFMSSKDEEYIPLKDEDLYHRLALGDVSVLDRINQDSPIPQSKESPGERGSPIPGIEGFHDPSSLGLQKIFHPLYFDTNDYVVRGKENLEVIDEMVEYLKKSSNVYLFVEGHCDERGPAAYNLALGTRRSNSVRNLLIKGGVNLNQIFTVSYGKERPVAFGHSPGDWRKNRRTQFKLYQSL